MRCFIALEPESAWLETLEAACGPLRARLSGWRWTRKEGRHLTLAFLGEIGEEGSAALEAAREAVRAATGFPAPEIRFDRLVLLPSRRKPRVLALGADRASDGVRRVAAIRSRVGEALAGAARSRGIANPDAEAGRPFLCHLSLARASAGPGRTGAPPFDAAAEFATMPVSAQAFARFQAVTLFRSVLGPGGARYEPLERAILAPPGAGREADAG
ncbi:MAG TPA: RNA 2',3'-cyclic phosphodiesterase [Spirochaetales bacterium]|nr:RNA 2',3'-cyclic phosphodiesterase [Spirochaetales bacterium]